MDWKKYLEEIKAAQNEIESLPKLSPEQEKKLWYRIRLDWNYHSNSMEGNTLTISETATLLIHARHAGNKLGRHYDEMKLHDEVLFYLLEIIREDIPINEKLIRELHASMMGDDYTIDATDPYGNEVKAKGRPGQYKNSPNYVQRGKEIYRYTAVEDVAPKMYELVNWLNDELAKKELHPIEIAAIFHVRFVTIHPFDDGNGRIGRILMNLILMKSKLAPAIIQREEKPQYLDALVLAQDGENHAPLLNLVAKETYNSMMLRLKAYRGESLERQDDWEKEADLLKQQMKDVQDPLVRISAELVRDCYNNSIDPLFHRFIEKMKANIADFFLEQQFYYGLSNQLFKEKEEFKSALIKVVNPNVLEIDTMKILSEFKGFKLSNYEQTAVFEEILVQFSAYYYEIFTTGRSGPNAKIIKKRYSQTLSHEEMDELIAHIGKQVTKRIKDLIEQANRNAQ